MTSTSTQLIAGVLRQPNEVDHLHWVLPEVPFRTAQDYAATEYLYRLRLCAVQVSSAVLLDLLHNPASSENHSAAPSEAPSPFTPAQTRILQYPVQVTAQLRYMDEPLSPIVESSAVYASAVTAAAPTAHPSTCLPPRTGAEEGRDSPQPASASLFSVDFVFAEEWIIFPLELCDVPLDATCELRLWYNDTHVGAATFYVYSVAGELRVGQQHVTLSSASCADPQHPDLPAKPGSVAAPLLDDYHRGRFPVIPWLDALSVQQLEAQQALRARTAAKARDVQASRGASARHALLTFYLPTATTAVFFEPAVARVRQDMQPLLSTTADARDQDPNASAAPALSGGYTQRLFPDQYTFFKDHNLSEAKAAITAKSQYFVSESSAPPGPKERHQLNSLLRRPPIQLHHGGSGGGGGGTAAGIGASGLNRLEETRLLWKYRHFICKDGRFLLPFMRSVDWANTHSTERRAACALMHQWARPGFADTLACLSFYFDHVAPVRQYAVRLLRQESDVRLCQVIFQLLQAVRYDSAEQELATLLLDRAAECWEVCSTVYTMLTVEVALERRRSGHSKSSSDGGMGSPTPPPSGGLTSAVTGGGGGAAAATAARASRGAAANAVFEPLLRRLAERLTQQSPHFVARLRQQHAMHRVLQLLSRQVQQSALDRLGKTALGNKLIAKQSCGMHALFDTLRHRAPHRSGSAANLDGAHAPTMASTAHAGNSSFATDAATAAAPQMQGESDPESGSDGGDVEEDEGRNTTATSAGNLTGTMSGAGGGGGVTSPAVAAVPMADSLSSGTAAAPGHRRTAPLHRGASSGSAAVGTGTVDLLDRSGVATLPTYPAIPITGILPNSLYIFKSAKLPMRLTFKALRAPAPQHVPPATITRSPALETAPGSPTVPSLLTTSASHCTTCLPLPLAMQQQQQQRGPAAAGQRYSTTAASITPGSNNNNNNISGSAAAFVEDPVGSAEEDTVALAMMYKYDDDVRQDQLIVQLIRVMDDLLQQDGLQLYLTPYRVVATGPNEGLVEIVPQVTTFLSVQREVLKYLRVYNPTAELLRQAMDRYTRSFAGYCVITFVLGIGDRHLENILLTQDGRLLHIDFGYVFGNDPKPFPPPMKINREMVEVLGGPQSTGFMEFKLYCCSAYNILRKHAALLLHMLLLGAHAENMPQVTGEGGDPRVNLLKVQEKLRLDLTNAQATQYLQNVIADSVGSIFTNLWDVLHAAAQATRS